ncbi:MAG: PHP domain-containing protein [Clostridiaceae bacterium]|nr:PHP domain-containing protein [Clostridiaceae bacterium]
MDIDLHCHAKLSKKSKFSIKHFTSLQQTAIRNGLQAIALTEHFNTWGFEEVYEALECRYTYRDDYYDVDGLMVFCGMEVDVREGGHILVIGKRDDVLNLQKTLLPFMTKDKYPPMDYLLEEAEKREMLKIGAHPYRDDHSLGRLDVNLLKRLDFLELNGKDFKKGDSVIKLADSVDLSVVAGSDTHHWLQVGCVKNRLAEYCYTVSQLKRCLKEGRYYTVISPWIGLRLTSAGIVKKMLKKIHSA